MNCSYQQLRRKEVINAANGCRIGFIDDIEIDEKQARVKALVVFGRPGFLGIFGKSDDCIVPWDKIRLIGEDTILVESFVQKTPNKARNRHKFVTFCHRLNL